MEIQGGHRWGHRDNPAGDTERTQMEIQGENRWRYTKNTDRDRKESNKDT